MKKVLFIALITTSIFAAQQQTLSQKMRIESNKALADRFSNNASCQEDFSTIVNAISNASKEGLSAIRLEVNGLFNAENLSYNESENKRIKVQLPNYKQSSCELMLISDRLQKEGFKTELIKDEKWSKYYYFIRW